MDLPNYSYAKVAFFMNLAKIQNESLKASLPFENISPWQTLIDPVNICNDITSRLTKLGQELVSYQLQQKTILDGVLRQTMLSREKFEVCISNNDTESQQKKSSQPLAYRIGRGGRLVSIPRFSGM